MNNNNKTEIGTIEKIKQVSVINCEVQSIILLVPYYLGTLMQPEMQNN